MPVPTASSPREITIALPDLPEALNPLYDRSWPTRVLSHLFLAGLWRLDGCLTLHPQLAVEVPSRANGGISDDGRALTVHLDPRATWSDGEPLTAADLLFTYEMAISEANHPVHRFPYADFVSSIEAPDAHTVIVHFTRPFAPWPSTLFPYVLPRHVLQPVFERDGTLDRAVWNRLPTIGSGPFVFVGVQAGDLLFVPNLGHWQGSPAVDRLRVRAIPDPQARWQAAVAGEVDVAVLLWTEIGGLLTPPAGLLLERGPSGAVETLFFNLDPRTGHPALQQQEVRQAIAAALDRTTLCDLLPGPSDPATSLWAGTVFEAPNRAPGAGASVDSLLSQAGWVDSDGDGVREREGVELTLRYGLPASGVDRTAMTAAVAQRLAPIGVQIVTATLEQGWDLAQWAAPPAGYPDPDDPRWLCVEARSGGMNTGGVCDVELDELLYAQASTPDPVERAALFAAIDDLNARQVWWLPLCRLHDVWLVSDHLQGFAPWREGPFWNAAEWEWADKRAGAE